MKIALIRREYITHLDGVNRFIAWLAEGLYKLGHEPVILSWCFKEDVPRDELGKWFKEIHGLDVELPIETLRNRPCRGNPWAKILLDWYAKGGSILKGFGAEVAIVNGVVPLRFKPKIAVAHGPLPTIFRWRRLVLKTLYSAYDAVVCVSKASQREYRGITTCGAIIPLPMKLDLYRPRSVRENIVVHIGTRHIKNPHISVEAVEMLRSKGVGVELYIIGSGTPYIEELAKNKPYVHLLFDVSEKEKIDVLCRARALVLPSSGETFSFTTLEAMACGTPPVVSSAVPEEVVVNGFNGLKIDSLDPKEYAEALEKLLTDDELWKTLSMNGLDFVKQFNYIDVARRYVGLIKRFIP
ncbi:MAG: glycosyltransferase family 4 protein [Ignisphaera sp.]|uniref:glycosyltransferase family 4 protein n=1 Tax=Thermoprotei TaxID=183924 RepID=UPI0031662DD5